MGLEVTGRLFAHHVDGPARPASASEQPGGAFEYLDAVIDRRIGECVTRRVLRVLQDGNAVVLEVFNGKAARVVTGAVAVIGGHGDAGRVAHDVVDRV